MGEPPPEERHVPETTLAALTNADAFVITDLGVFPIGEIGGGLSLIERADAISIEGIRARTGAESRLNI